MNYEQFIASKRIVAQSSGFAPYPMGDHLFDFQAAATAFCIERGRAALFLDTGLGKTICELEFAAQCVRHNGMPALILTPLAVARQIESEALRFGYSARVVRNQDQVGPGINICNYDRMDGLDAAAFGCVVLDESSVLKSWTGRTTRALIAKFADTPYRLAATATPAPNDHTELGTHAEFLGVMPYHEMLMRWFLNDSADTGQWRLKGHAVRPFWDWCASWAVMAESPADLGFDASRFVLPPLRIHRHKVAGDIRPAHGSLFAGDVSATDMHAVKRQTADARATALAELVNAKPADVWIIWSDSDYEQDAARAVLPRVCDVRGSMTAEKKEAAILQFTSGNASILSTKASVMGAGLNLQRCHNVVFIGRSFSYEQWYQAVRRCWRFGQTQPVDVHLMVAEGEDQIGRVIDQKSEAHSEMKSAMRAATARNMGVASRVRVPYDPKHIGRLPRWIAA